MQQITITGYLSRDAEIRSTRGDDKIANWSVPVRQGFGEKERTNWFRVSIWGKRAEYAAKARKGEFVTVTGELTIGEYEGKPQYEIRAMDFQSIRPAPRDGDGGAPVQHSRQASADVDDLSDEVPFASNEGIW